MRQQRQKRILANLRTQRSSATRAYTNRRPRNRGWILMAAGCIISAAAGAVGGLAMHHQPNSCSRAPLGASRSEKLVYLRAEQAVRPSVSVAYPAVPVLYQAPPAQLRPVTTVVRREAVVAVCEPAGPSRWPQSSGVSLGVPRSKVIDTLGRPRCSGGRGGREALMYAEGMVVVEDGRVCDIKRKVSYRSPRRMLAVATRTEYAAVN